jgi:precorrin-3B C17-methyltransferase
VEAIRSAQVVVGYHKYVELVRDLCADKTCIATGMTQERARVESAIALCRQGQRVALVSSGDPGVYGMAGLALELLGDDAEAVRVEIIPGITAANSAAARLGAPLMLDYCCISLSDLMVPWDKIARRLEAAGQGDFVVALYNPRSHKRRRQLEQAVEILSAHRPASTPVGIVHQIGLEDEGIELATLGTLLEREVHMRSLVIIGNQSSRVAAGFFLTPRGYLADADS